MSKQEMCDQFPECGLQQWLCDDLQDLVHEETYEARVASARAIRLKAGKLMEGNDLQPSDPKATEGSSKAQLIRNLGDLYDEYRKYHINQWRAGKHLTLSFDGFISYLRGQL